ncbi:MAG: hypothetical protein WCP52_09490 [Bacteroidota bacterium]
MSRIVYPEAFNEQRTLLAEIKAKHDADGAGSDLKAFLTQKFINLNDDQTAGDDAFQADKLRLLKSKQSENFMQLRKIYIDPITSNMRGIIQFLKSFNKPNTDALGDWGVKVVGGKRIDFPTKFIDIVILFDNIKEKHDSYTNPPSPLTAYLTKQSLDMAAMATDVANANDNNTLGIQAAKDSEEAYQKRNILWEEVVTHIHDIGEFLMTLYKGNSKKLGEYGYVVDDSPQKPKDRTTKIKLSSQVLVDSLVIGSTLKNTGITDLHLYKGKTTTGTPIIVHPGEMWGVPKGYSMITVINPSALDAGSLVAKRYK